MPASSEPSARIFLLSHMRAFTSLAGHLLGSHPQVNGYFEMHISYDDASALDRQLVLLRESEEIKPNSRYLFDKLLHNDYLLRPEKLAMTDMKILVSLREPEQSIKSIVKLFRRKGGEELYASPVEAARYYAERLSALADFCDSTGRDYSYFDADLLQTAPDMLLPALSGWLALDSPLQERYRTFSQTGKPGKGDSSDLIHTGRIDRRQVDYSDVKVPEQVLARATRVYRECRRRIVDKAADSLTHQGSSE